VKYELKDLDAFCVEGEIVRMRGKGGVVGVRCLAANAFEIWYEFDALSSFKDDYSTRIDAICNDWSGFAHHEPFHVSEFDDEYVIASATTSLRICRATGTISCFYGDTLVFGGRLGLMIRCCPNIRCGCSRSCHLGRKFNFRATDEDMFIGLGEKSGLLDKILPAI